MMPFYPGGGDLWEEPVRPDNHFPWRSWFLGGLSLALLLAFVFKAFPQEHHNHPPQDSAIHDQFYDSWLMPDVRYPAGHEHAGQRYRGCCNKHDCYPTTVKRVGGVWMGQRREDGKWLVIPESKLEHNQIDPRESPDGRSHMCAPAPVAEADFDIVFCATLGSGQ